MIELTVILKRTPTLKISFGKTVSYYYNRGNYINKRWKILITILCGYNLHVLNKLLVKHKKNFTYISD